MTKAYNKKSVFAFDLARLEIVRFISKQHIIRLILTARTSLTDIPYGTARMLLAVAADLIDYISPETLPLVTLLSSKDVL
jgi:hypothetical protein